jgi:hypothetical protein
MSNAQQPSSKERVDLQKIIDQLRAAASFARNKIVMPDVESGKLMDAAASAIEYARQVADASVDVQFERGCYVLMEMMKAYERRIRSDCTTQEQLDAKPWECSEYITAARYLVKFWPPYSSTRAAEPPVVIRSESVDFLQAMFFDSFNTKVSRENVRSILEEAMRAGLTKSVRHPPLSSETCPACKLIYCVCSGEASSEPYTV